MVGEHRSGSALAVAAFCTLGFLAGVARGQDLPVLSIEGGMGMPGGTVAALTALDNDPEATAAAADLLVRFPDTSLNFDPANCSIAERLGGTHALSGDTPNPGEVHLAIDPIGDPSPLGDGPLATCDVGILLGAMAGTAALDLSGTLFLGDGTIIPSESLDGTIVIVSGEPTATVTHTGTPTVTPTVTETPLPTLTHTPSQTPTATLFQPTVLFDRVGSTCAVGGGIHDAWPLLGALALFLRRRGKS